MVESWLNSPIAILLTAAVFLLASISSFALIRIKKLTRQVLDEKERSSELEIALAQTRQSHEAELVDLNKTREWLNTLRNEVYEKTQALQTERSTLVLDRLDLEQKWRELEKQSKHLQDVRASLEADTQAIAMERGLLERNGPTTRREEAFSKPTPTGYLWLQSAQVFRFLLTT